MNIEIIAEAAQGYLGDPPGKTRLLVDCAAAGTADVVKFQLVHADEICTPDHQHYELFQRLEMSDAEWRAVVEQAHVRRIRIAFDIFGERSLAAACAAGADGLKLHSTDVLNLALIRLVAASPILRVYLSAGGTFEPEIAEAVGLLAGKSIVLLHGFQGYPTETDANQLARIAQLRSRFPQCQIGFADHVPEGHPERFWLSVAAVGAGATAIEKHLTTATVLREEDHESAINPDEFAVFAANMRLAAAAVGEPAAAADFGMSPAEQEYRRKMKKQVVAARPLDAGVVLRSEHLVLKRTSVADGVFRDLRDVEGRRLKRAVERDRPIRQGDLA